jgi:hypothetical protein
MSKKRIANELNRTRNLFIAGVVVLLLGLGLVIYWKISKTNSTILQPPLSASPLATSEDPVLESQKIPNEIHAEVLSIPHSQWSLYKNFTYNFSFQFPNSWKLDEQKMKVAPLPPKEIGGGYNAGIIIDEIFENKERLTLDDFIIRFEKKYNPEGSSSTIYKKVPVKTNVLAIAVDPHTDGAVDGQLVFIQDKTMRIIKIYCPSCTDEVVKKLTDTFQNFDK